MARGVLGNDPFRRGAAAHAPKEEDVAPRPTTPADRPGKGKRQKPRASPPPKPADAAMARAPASAQSAALSSRTAKAASAKTSPGAKPRAMAVDAVKAKPARGKAAKATAKAAKAVPQSRASASAGLAGGLPPAARTERSSPPAAPALPHAPRDPGHARTPGAPSPSPHLVLVANVDRAEEASTPSPETLPIAPRDGLVDRTARALGFAWDLAASGMQGPTVVDSLRVGRGLARAALSGVGTLWGQRVDDYGRDPELISDLSPLTDLLYSRYWRVTVQGAVHVPAGPVLLVSNHSGVMPYDGPVLQQILTRERPDLPESRWLVEDQIFHAPFFGTLFNRLGALRACPDNARRLLEEGRPVFVFPEGAQGLGKPYRERHQLKRFGRGGFVKIALRARVPIVPVAVVGAEETSPLLARLPGSIFGLGYVPVTPLGPLPLPARWMVRFGEPLETEGLGPDDADTLPVVQRLTERTRESIQGMRQALLRERRGVFSG